MANHEMPSLHEGKPGYDAWGVHQTPTATAGGMFTPTPGLPPVLADVTKWRELAIPDHNKADWETLSKMEMKIFNIDRENYLLTVASNNGLFERMHMLMGFENAVMALVTEPEACYELAGAIADTKIDVIHQAAKWYKPDVFTMLDDYSHKNGLFMSPATWREIFQPHLKRIVKACHDEGMLYKHHCCGKCEKLLPDLMDCGIDALDPVQPVNDIPAMKQLTLGKIGLYGGLNVQDIIDQPGVTEEQIRQECRRCIDAYAPGGGYVVYGVSIDSRAVRFGDKTKAEMLIEECASYGQNWYARHGE
ncbi:MAG: uroporphyrinogen decarboxylase family protein [Clostridia bacterium]|nr:uroporphyrinogen decarboxylase family protein [Clostridia bacterium]